jgi:hypothetical protein
MRGGIVRKLNDESGFILVTAIVILLLLIVIGIAANTTSTIEIQMASVDKTHTMSFYAAEAGRSYAHATPELYGPSNVVEGEGVTFPDPADPAERYTLGEQAGQTFSGTVTYEGSGALPRGSGFSEDFEGHYYIIESQGYGPGGAEAKVRAKGYRVGF